MYITQSTLKKNDVNGYLFRLAEKNSAVFFLIILFNFYISESELQNQLAIALYNT